MLRGEVYLQQRTNSIAAMLVVSNNACNRYSDKVTCVPIARTVNRNMPTHVVIPASSVANQLSDNSVALCEKIQMINKETLQGPIAMISDQECMQAINHALQVQIGIFDAYTQPPRSYTQEPMKPELTNQRPLEMPRMGFGG